MTTQDDAAQRDAEGARGLWKDAVGAKWTLGVHFLVDALATVWFITWLLDSDRLGALSDLAPVAAIVRSLEQVGLEAPLWLADLSAWLAASAASLVPVLTVATVVLCLLATARPFEQLYGSAAVLGTLVTIEATQSLWPVTWIAGSLTGLSVLAWCLGALTERFKAPADLDYFGSRQPGRVLLQALFTLAAPLNFVLMIVGAVRSAYTLGPRRRIWQAFEREFKRLEADAPNEACRFRVEVLLRLAERERGGHLSMINDFLLGEVASGATPVRLRPPAHD